MPGGPATEPPAPLGDSLDDRTLTCPLGTLLRGPVIRAMRPIPPKRSLLVNHDE